MTAGRQTRLSGLREGARTGQEPRGVSEAGGRGRVHLAGKIVSIGGVDLGCVGQLLGLVGQGRWELQLCKRLVKLVLDVLGTWHLHTTYWAFKIGRVTMLYGAMNKQCIPRRDKTGESFPFKSLLRQVPYSSVAELLKMIRTCCKSR